MKGRKAKAIVCLVLALSLLVGTGVGYFALRYQGKPVVNDRTSGGSGQNQTGESSGETGAAPGGEGTDREPEAVLSASVSHLRGESADLINEAILSLESSDAGVLMEIASGTEFDSLGTGDIFCLEGDEDSPFGMTYIGKVVSVVSGDDSDTYLLETPMIDEVFDKLSFDYSEVLTADNLISLDCAEGVTVSGGTIASQLGYTNGTAQVVMLNGSPDVLDDFEFNVDLDMLAIFGLKTKKVEYQEKIPQTQASSVLVYRTTTGMCYHLKSCPCVARSQYDMTLAEAIAEGYEACNLCLPPVVEEGGVLSAKPKLDLEGKFALKGLSADASIDWDILDGEGIRELSFDFGGRIEAELELNGNVKVELSAKTTKAKFGSVSFEGLKERMFPLAAIRFGSTVSFANSNDEIRALTGMMPVSVIGIVYVDASGTLSLGMKAGVYYTADFHYTKVLYEDSQYVNRENCKFDQDLDVKAEAELKGDADVHGGLGMEIYVFNLKVVQADVVQVGLEAEGSLKFEYSLKEGVKGDQPLFSDYFARIYLKWGVLSLKFKSKADLFFATVQGSTQEDFVFKDQTLVEWGKKNPTRFVEDTMSYSHLTAHDDGAVYFKELDGTLVREKNKQRQVIYSDPFFSICGIDSSYLYLLVPNSEGHYDIYRVMKDGTASKKLVENVSNCLTIDEDYIYFVEAFDATVIRRINRYDLKDTVFADFGKNVTYMTRHGENFYTVTQDNDIFSAIFGADCYYCLLDRDGNTVADYGSNPSVLELNLWEYENYFVGSKTISSGYLRNVAEHVYWISKDKSASIKTDRLSGWNYYEAGIVTTLNNDTGSEEPYKVVLYQAADGECRDLFTVHHDHAFFTLCQGPQREWYYFDQTDSELILYCLREDFTDRTELKRFSLDELPCNLNDCSVSLTNGRLYFYTMPDDHTSTMLYRYDIKRGGGGFR